MRARTHDDPAPRRSRRTAIAAAFGLGLATAGPVRAKRRARRDGDPDAYALEGERDGNRPAAANRGEPECWPAWWLCLWY